MAQFAYGDVAAREHRAQLLEGNRGHQPFTAPAVSPATIRRCATRTITATGTVATTAPARISPHGTWYWPRKSAIATGTV